MNYQRFLLSNFHFVKELWECQSHGYEHWPSPLSNDETKPQASLLRCFFSNCFEILENWRISNQIKTVKRKPFNSTYTHSHTFDKATWEHFSFPESFSLDSQVESLSLTESLKANRRLRTLQFKLTKEVIFDFLLNITSIKSSFYGV